MTIEQGAVEAVVKIRPAGPLWIAFFVLGGFMVGLGVDALASGRPWFALLGLVLGCCSLAVAYLLRVFGLDLTPELAIVRDPRQCSLVGYERIAAKWVVRRCPSQRP